VLFDDMEDEEMVLNDQRRKKFWNNFYGAIKPIIRRNGKIRGVGTIIGFGSFLESVMPNEKSEENTVIEPLRVFSKTITPWMSVKYRAHDPGMETILWPQQFSREDLLAERADYAQRGMLDIYGQEYLNNPIDETTAYFRKADLIGMTDEDRSKRKEYYVGVDLAIGESDRSAYTVFVVGGVDSEGILHIVDVRRDRWDSLEIMNEFFSVQLAWEPAVMRVESENIAKSIGPMLYDAMGRDGNPFLNIDDKPPTKDKDKRGRGMQMRTRARRVKFDKDADWYPDFEEEVTKYPKYAYKDQFDAFSWLGLMLDEMDLPSTPEEDAENEYQEELEAFMPMGRCATTGY
jgi:predicted phage terminase large subunit-like protein